MNKLIFIFIIVISPFLTGCSSTGSSTAARPLETGAAQAQQANQNKQWRCLSDQQQWLCEDLASASKVAEKNALAVATSNPVIETEPEVSTAAQVVLTPTASNQPIVLSQYPGHYLAVQLLAATEDKSIAKFLQQHPQLSPLNVTVVVDGKPLQLLILGAYPDYQQAKAAIDDISPALAIEPWIRPLAPLTSSLITTQ
ncbi:MAG: septal ring-binding cell division protein DamX [Oceanicoccus sp.]